MYYDEQTVGAATPAPTKEDDYVFRKLSQAIGGGDGTVVAGSVLLLFPILVAADGICRSEPCPIIFHEVLSG